MKVVILTGEPFPNGMAATNRIACYARALKEGGVGCEVVIFRRTEKYGEETSNEAGEGFFNGIPFRYVSGTAKRGKNSIIRQINDRIDIRRTVRYLKHNLQNGDVLFMFMGGYVELMLRFMNVAQSKGAYCVRDLCELPYGTGAETERAIRLRKMTIEKQFPLLDGIISISDALMNLAQTYTTPKCKHIKVPIMVDYSHFVIKDKSASFDEFYLFHSGTLHQQKDGILGMIEAFAMARRRLKIPIKYILTGSIDASPQATEIRKLIDKYNIRESIEFVGYLNRNQVKEYLRKAALVISNRPKSKQDYYGFSTKVGEYLASGTPLIATNWGEAVNWLNDSESAYIIEPENTEVLADAIVHVFNNPEEAKRVGKAGQEVCEKCFDYRNWSEPLVNFMNQLGK